MNALDLLKSQHDEVKELFEEITKAEDADEKLSLLQELADNFAAHAAIEEKLFYPAAYADSTKELLTEAVEEHLSAKRILADLLQMDSEDENFDAKLTVLKEQIEHHVEEEEGDLFKKVKGELGKEELDALGVQMEDMFEDELANEPSERIPDETAEAAPLPKRKTSRTRPSQ